MRRGVRQDERLGGDAGYRNHSASERLASSTGRAEGTRVLSPASATLELEPAKGRRRLNEYVPFAS